MSKPIKYPKSTLDTLTNLLLYIPYLLSTILTNVDQMNNSQMQIVVFVLLCVLIDYFALVKKLHCDKMCHSKSLNVENYSSLNDQLSLDGLNDHCDYIEPSLIKELHTQSTDLGVMQLNVRGLLNKQTQIKHLLSDNNVLLPIDMVLLCET